jgi:hypothetical protein
VNAAPAYSLARRKTGRVRTSKLHRDHVVEMRRWVRREGFGLPLREQVSVLHLQYRVGAAALYDILANRAWFDPAYDPAQPDAEWARAWETAPLALLVLYAVRRMYTSVDSSVAVVDRGQDASLAQGPERVLDRAHVEPGGVGQRLGGADLHAA